MQIVKLDHLGHERMSYSGQLVRRDAEVVVVRCVWQAVKPFAVGSFVLAGGDLFLEHYFTEQRFNIMVVYSPAGVLKGAYCNITDLAEIGPEQIRWRDWLLDLLVLPDGRTIELDRDEFEEADLSAQQREQAEAALDALRSWAAERRWPLDFAPLASIDTRG